MEYDKKFVIIKILILILAVAAFVGLIASLLPTMTQLTTTEGQVAFKEKVDSLGFGGILLLFGIQLVQILLIVLPGEPLEILAGMCYGAVGGTIFIFVTVFLTTTLIVFLVRKYGKKCVYLFFKKEKVDKIENSNLFKDPRKIEIILVILFLIPGTPKDLLVYLGGLLPIHPLKFILISTFARFPSVISSTLAGANIAFGNWHISLLIYLIFFAITGIIIYFVRKFDKRKITEHTINTLK